MRFKTYLRHLLKYIFDTAFDPEGLNLTEEQLAAKAKLHVSTIYKLRTGRTQDPKHQTIWKLIRATGLNGRLIAEEMEEMASA